MNISFKLGESINGWTIIDNNGLTEFVATDGNVNLVFQTDAGEGRNYSKVIKYYNHKTRIGYRAFRFTRKYIRIAQMLSSMLYFRYREVNALVDAHIKSLEGDKPCNL